MIEGRQGNDRRAYRRADATLVVSYRAMDMPYGFDISHCQNVSQGGMLLTTHCAFDQGTRLDIAVRLPFLAKAVEATADVVESRQLVPEMIYDTRITFLELDTSALQALGDFVAG